MAAPDDKPAFDLDIAMHAADHFKARKKQRDIKAKAIEEGQYTKAESPQRLAKRVKRLVDAVKGQVAMGAVSAEAGEPIARALPNKVQELMKQDEVAPETVTDAMVERVIGATRDFLAIGFFEKGAIASRAVCRIVTNLGGGRRGFGTGFMVTPSLLMTNNHVLASEDQAGRSVAEFNYQLTETGTPLPLERFELRPDLFFLTDRDLDFTLVAIEQRSTNGTALTTFGFCPLIAAEGKILVRDPVNIVQHPKGELKQIVIRNNTLLDLPEKAPLDKYAHYETDTEQGSSGSPVFNDQWEVIALHHSGVPRTNAKKQILDREGNVWPSNGDPDDIDWVSNEGIRTSRLVAFIKAAAVREREKALQAEFLAISSGNSPVPAATPKPAPEVALASTEAVRKPLPPSIPPPPAQPRRPAPAAQDVAMPRHGTVSLTIPLTVSINLGAPQGQLARTAALAVQPAETELEAAIQPDPDYSDRPGFGPEARARGRRCPDRKLRKAPPAPPPPLPAPAAQVAATPRHGTVSLTIPLTVSINLGAPPGQPAIAAEVARAVRPTAPVSGAPPARYEREILSEASADRTVDLLFATTRKPAGGDDSTDFTDERSFALAFGATKVRVPERHAIGRIERPWELGLFGWSIYAQAEDPQKHFTISASKRLTREAFIGTLNAEPNQALVFVHGFNTLFDDACYRLAQIVWDTQFAGIPIVFSWPSQGRVLAYFYDRDSAIFSRIGFGELLAILLGASKLSAVHILAHSMGNQIVLDVLSALGQQGAQSSLTEVIFAAPDVDREVFIALAPRLEKSRAGIRSMRRRATRLWRRRARSRSSRVPATFLRWGPSSFRTWIHRRDRRRRGTVWLQPRHLFGATLADRRCRPPDLEGERRPMCARRNCAAFRKPPKRRASGVTRNRA